MVSKQQESMSTDNTTTLKEELSKLMEVVKDCIIIKEDGTPELNPWIKQQVSLIKTAREFNKK